MTSTATRDASGSRTESVTDQQTRVQMLAQVSCPWCTYDGGIADLGDNLCSQCSQWFFVHEDGEVRPTEGPTVSPRGGA